MQMIGKVASKQYQCQTCETVSRHETNHYGEIYLRCNNCGGGTRIFECIEPLPEGWSRPERWQVVRLGEIAKVAY